MESTVQYNQFLDAYIDYIDEHDVKMPQDVSIIAEFLDEYVQDHKQRQTICTTLIFCINHAIIDLKEEIETKWKSPGCSIPSKWFEFLQTMSIEIQYAFRTLPNADREKFVNSTSKSVGKAYIRYVFSKVYPRHSMIDPIYNRLRCIAFHEFLRAHYPTLMNVKIPRIVSWGEPETVKFLRKHNIELKPEHTAIVEH